MNIKKVRNFTIPICLVVAVVFSLIGKINPILGVVVGIGTGVGMAVSLMEILGMGTSYKEEKKLRGNLSLLIISTAILFVLIGVAVG
ncbi:hypothetical protein ISS37_05945 [candidate division KSB1 bacterium]|nr:hypothetical protein [candidate division KSB1 bacterium]